LQARKDVWLKRVSRLYADVRKWLADLERDGVLRFDLDKVALEEREIGQYDVEVLTLAIGKQQVAFCPKGTLIVGADGRIDIQGQRGVRTIIFSGGRWHLVTRTPKLRLLPFNEDSFQDVLSEVMR